MVGVKKKKSRLFYLPSQGSFHTWMVALNNQGPEWSPASGNTEALGII